MIVDDLFDCADEKVARTVRWALDHLDFDVSVMKSRLPKGTGDNRLLPVRWGNVPGAYANFNGGAITLSGGISLYSTWDTSTKTADQMVFYYHSLKTVIHEIGHAVDYFWIAHNKGLREKIMNALGPGYSHIWYGTKGGAYSEIPAEAFASVWVHAYAFVNPPEVKGHPNWSNPLIGIAPASCVPVIKKLLDDTYKAGQLKPTFPNDSVYRLYRAYFLREPDHGGYEYWKNKLAAGVSLEDVSNGFANSTEFRNQYGDLTDQEFITQVYRNVLNREPDAGGFAHWEGHLRRGATRGRVMIGFSESTEFFNRFEQ